MDTVVIDPVLPHDSGATSGAFLVSLPPGVSWGEWEAAARDAELAFMRVGGEAPFGNQRLYALAWRDSGYTPASVKGFAGSEWLFDGIGGVRCLPRDDGRVDVRGMEQGMCDVLSEVADTLWTDARAGGFSPGALRHAQSEFERAALERGHAVPDHEPWSELPTAPTRGATDTHGLRRQADLSLHMSDYVERGYKVLLRPSDTQEVALAAQAEYEAWCREFLTEDRAAALSGREYWSADGARQRLRARRSSEDTRRCQEAVHTAYDDVRDGVADGRERCGFLPGSFRIDGHELRLPKIGAMPMAQALPCLGEVLRGAVVRDGANWWLELVASVQVDGVFGLMGVAEHGRRCAPGSELNALALDMAWLRPRLLGAFPRAHVWPVGKGDSLRVRGVPADELFPWAERQYEGLGYELDDDERWGACGEYECV